MKNDEVFRAVALFWLTGTSTYMFWHLIIAMTPIH